jgi:uncharacterized membrane protein YkvA (DUF1232 family)
MGNWQGENNNEQNNNQNNSNAPPNPDDKNESPKGDDKEVKGDNKENNGENKENNGDDKEKNPNVIINEAENNPEQNDNSNNAAPPNNENSDCPVPADLSKYESEFSFDGLMNKIKESAKKAGLKAIYMALLLYYALESPTISTMDKAIIYGALGYFICPIDIVPDIIPFIGLTDDIAVLAWAFSRVKRNVTDMTREKAKTKLKIWFGNYDEKEIDDL